MKIHFFFEDTHLPQRCPNPSAITWSLVLQTRNLANKIEDFSKCDDFSGEIIQLTDNQHCSSKLYIERSIVPY
jgi:hypothetical protein